MLRSLIVGLGVTLMASSDVLGQSCVGNPVAVQVLGSGAPGFVRDRANTRRAFPWFESYQAASASM